MKTAKILVMIAMCGSSLTPAFVTPAFAAIDGVYGNIYPALDLECDAFLKPGENSGFTTFALVDTNVPGTSVVETVKTVDTGIKSTAGVGTPVISGVNFTKAHVNGQSPNIWGVGGRTVTYPQTKVTHFTLTTTTTKVTAACHVHKFTGGTVQDNDPGHPGYKINPPGLNKDIVTSETTSTSTGEREEITNEPWIDPVATTLNKNLLICISPGPKGGSWRNMHGYVNGSLGLGSNCSTTWYYTLQGINPIPSQSLPPAE